MKLKNKVCIVTGAASGIGKEIALSYAREGGKVVIADLKLEAAQATADEIVKAGGTAMAVVMYVTSEEQVEAGVNQRLLRQGVIVRPISGYGMPEWLRVSIGLESENARFLEVMPAALA